MSRNVELLTLLLVDACAFGAATAVHHLARYEWGWLEPPSLVLPSALWPKVVVISLFWLFLFLFFGLYRERYADSRFDELVSIVKVSTVGVLVLTFLIFIESLLGAAGRQGILFYWWVQVSLVSLGRIGVRSVQKLMILRGHGLHRALIVGWSDEIERLYEDVARYPEAGLNIVGAIRLQPNGAVAPTFEEASAEGDGANVVTAAPTVAYTINDLPRLIDELAVQDVLIALGSGDQQPLMDVLRLCDGKAVSLKLVPSFYTIIGGMARTEHIYGLPLIEVLPEPMPAWEQSTKRLIDVLVALVVLAVGLPMWMTLGVLVRFTSPGPAIYRQRRVGQHGKAFTMLKYRTMRQDAEAQTGPVWATENDPRYTPLGRWLRKTRLDEVPQLWNVLKGEMSLVGPRPERPYFVDKLAAEIPLYSRRHRVKPGITGWAQVKWRYDTSLEDVRQKVKYDLFYIENMSLRMDFKILLRTIRTALSGQGQ